jgi:hypothetical protein
MTPTTLEIGTRASQVSSKLSRPNVASILPCRSNERQEGNWFEQEGKQKALPVFVEWLLAKEPAAQERGGARIMGGEEWVSPSAFPIGGSTQEVLLAVAGIFTADRKD